MRISSLTFGPSAPSFLLVIFLISSPSFSEGVIENLFDLVRLAVADASYSQQSTNYQQNQPQPTVSQWKDGQKPNLKDLKNLAIRTNEAFRQTYETNFAQLEEIFKAEGTGNVERLNKFHEIIKKGMEDNASVEKALREMKEDRKQVKDMIKIIYTLTLRTNKVMRVVFDELKQLAEEQTPEKVEQVKQIWDSLQTETRKEFKVLDEFIYQFFPVSTQVLDDIFKKAHERDQQNI